MPQYSEWGNLDLNHETVAKIDADKCIGCQLCVVACDDGAHQCIHPVKDGSTRVPVVDEAECVGCNLCQIVCPVPECITMAKVDNGSARRPGTSTLRSAASFAPRRPHARRLN